MNKQKAVLFWSCIAIFVAINVAFSDTNRGISKIEARFPSQLLIEELSGPVPGAADDGSPVQPILQMALDLIKAFEGWEANAYDDPAGYCTIGYGHLIKKDFCRNIELGKFSGSLSEEAGNQLLADDTRPARRIVQRLVKTPLTKRQFGALTSFIFNVGAGNFSQSTLLKRLNEGSFQQAAKEIRKWVNAGGKRYQGLVNRRNCETALFNDMELRRLPNGEIDTNDCASYVAAAPEDGETIDIVTGIVSR